MLSPCVGKVRSEGWLIAQQVLGEALRKECGVSPHVRSCSPPRRYFGDIFGLD